jgi:hypothetical protein
MVEEIVKQDIGLAVLTSSAVFGSWSAWNSSLFTVATFTDNEEKLKNAKLGMDIGFVTALATGAAVHYVYGKEGRFAAASAVLTGAALYIAYYMKLKANPKLTSYMMGGNKNGNGQLAWKPLAKTDLQYVKHIVDNDGISIFSEL